MRANRLAVPTLPRAGLAALGARARSARAAAIRDLLVSVIRKLTPALHVRRWGEHWG